MFLLNEVVVWSSEIQRNGAFFCYKFDVTTFITLVVLEIEEKTCYPRVPWSIKYVYRQKKWHLGFKCLIDKCLKQVNCLFIVSSRGLLQNTQQVISNAYSQYNKQVFLQWVDLFIINEGHSLNQVVTEI